MVGSSETTIDAVVLAGGTNTISLYPGYQPGSKALIPFQGKPSLCYVLEALRGCAQIGRIGIVGDERVLRPAVRGDCTFRQPTDSVVENLRIALALFPDAERILMAPADLPLLTAKAVEEFLHACQQETRKWGPSPDFRSADQSGKHNHIFISVVRKERFTGPYATTRKDMSRFRDGAFCHGNLILLDTALWADDLFMSRISALYAARKSPIKSALAVGPGLGLCYVVGVHFLHALTLLQMCRLASRRFGISLVPVLSSYPEIALDVDEPADYRLVCARLSTK